LPRRVTGWWSVPSWGANRPDLCFPPTFTRQIRAGKECALATGTNGETNAKNNNKRGTGHNYHTVKLIESEGRGLWGVVNNAGINIIDPMIEAQESDLKFLFDVNVYGVFRITKSFAPMVIESQGRIVNISSISGVLSGFPAYGMYTMSKHAVEAYTDQLAAEMAGFGVKVSGIEPGNFGSAIGTSRCKLMIANSANKEYEYFGDVMQEYLDGCKEYIAEGGVSSSPPPNLVADAIQHALFDDNPKEHYLVVADPFEAMITIGKALEEVLNLNHDHEYSYTREQLIAMMDEEWAILRGEKTRDWGIE